MTKQEWEQLLLALKTIAKLSHRSELSIALSTTISKALEDENKVRPISSSAQKSIAEKLVEFLADVDNIIYKGDLS